MEKIRNSSILRGICYILIPILVFIILMSFISEIISSEYGELESEKKFVQTEYFADRYFLGIISNLKDINNLEKLKENEDEYIEDEENRYSITRNRYVKIEDTTQNIYYQESNINLDDISNEISYIIINKKSGNIYTNIKINNLDNQISSIQNSENEHNSETKQNEDDKKTSELYWVCKDGKISTNIEKINQDNAKYIYSKYGESYYITNYNNYEIYTNFDTNKITLRSEI